MFDYLTGMSLFLPGDTVSDFIDTFKTHYDCGENYPNYSQFVYGYATLLAGGDYNFTLQKPEQSVGAPAAGLFSSIQNTAFVPGGSYVAPEDASNVPILSDVIAARAHSGPRDKHMGRFRQRRFRRQSRPTKTKRKKRKRASCSTLNPTMPAT